MADYYKILGISRSATKDEIGKAYRTLAKKYHPDLHPDDKNAKAKFQELQEAFEVLNDEKKRKQYDQFGPDFEKFQGGGAGGFGGFGGFGGSRNGGAEWEFNMDDLFGGQGRGGGGRRNGGGFDPGAFFRNHGGGRASARDARDFNDGFGNWSSGGSRGGYSRYAPVKGQDIYHAVTIPFEESVEGTEANISIRNHSGETRKISAKIPPGIEDGQKLRLHGLGESSPNGGPNGDLFLTVHVSPHHCFSRQGNDLTLRLPVSISEAVLGAKVPIPTPKGEGFLNIPPGTSSGKKLRIKGAGVQARSGAGDLFVEILVQVPQNVTQEEADMFLKMEQKNSNDLRAGIQW
ncbi:MAG: J domain-containing protein [Planctomycetaceae bacterium]|nr:J domain-containing protein [Planctomycetaceae bacterium]